MPSLRALMSNKSVKPPGYFSEMEIVIIQNEFVPHHQFLVEICLFPMITIS